MTWRWAHVWCVWRGGRRGGIILRR